MKKDLEQWHSHFFKILRVHRLMKPKIKQARQKALLLYLMLLALAVHVLLLCRHLQLSLINF